MPNVPLGFTRVPLDNHHKAVLKYNNQLLLNMMNRGEKVDLNDPRIGDIVKDLNIVQKAFANQLHVGIDDVKFKPVIVNGRVVDMEAFVQRDALHAGNPNAVDPSPKHDQQYVPPPVEVQGEIDLPFEDNAALPAGIVAGQYDSSFGLSTGAIIGIVVGSTCGLALIIFLILFFVRRSKQRRIIASITYPQV